MLARFRTPAAYVLGLFASAVFLDSLRFKFTGHETPHHIFTTLRDWSGIDLFYPAGPWIIGLAELASAVLLVALPLGLRLTKRIGLEALSQTAGALIALGVMTGAIGFHLFTPLGVETPVDWRNGEPVAWSGALFAAACMTWASAAIIIALRGPEALAALPRQAARTAA